MTTKPCFDHPLYWTGILPPVSNMGGSNSVPNPGSKDKAPAQGIVGAAGDADSGGESDGDPQRVERSATVPVGAGGNGDTSKNGDPCSGMERSDDAGCVPSSRRGPSRI